MKKVVKAPAKVNLFLRVHGKSSNGYHDLSMVMQAISLFDTIEFDIVKGEPNQMVRLTCNIPYIPTDDKNLVVKIIKYFIDEYGINDSFNVNLKKMIPTCGGLGGGSSDAASTILFLNNYYKLNIETSELASIASKFGSDIPFFIYGSECLCEGRGEIVTKLDSYSDYYVVIATPNIRVSTKDIFNQFDSMDISNLNSGNSDIDINNCIKAIESKDLRLLSKSLYNDLAPVTESNYDIIKIFRKKMIEYGAYNSMMSGSGPSVFGIFTSFLKALNCKRKMKREYKDAFIYISKPI